MALQITDILKKPEEDRTAEDKRLLDLSPDVAKDILKRNKSRKLAKERQLEVQFQLNGCMKCNCAMLVCNRITGYDTGCRRHLQSQGLYVCHLC